VDGVIAADFCALAASETSGVAEAESLEIKSGSFVAGGNAHLLELVVGPSVSGASYECYVGLQNCQVMKSIHDDLLLALDCAGHASYALVVVDDRMVVDDVYSVFGTGLLTGSARNASVSACGSHHLLVLLRGRAGNEVSSVSRDHLDQVLRTYSLLGAVAASVTFLGVDDDLTVHKLHSPFLAGLDT
jgi:hypothetical protein